MKQMNSILIVLAVVALCFFVGGGWHLLVPSDDFVYGLFYRLDTQQAEMSAWMTFFLFCGPAAALVGVVISIFVLAKQRKRKSGQ